jgi:hypothetical protein
MMALSDAETSGYLLIAAGVVWIAFGVAGLRWTQSSDKSEKSSEEG